MQELRAVNQSTDAKSEPSFYSPAEYAPPLNQFEILRDSWKTARNEREYASSTSNLENKNNHETIRLDKVYVYCLKNQRINQEILERFTTDKHLPVNIKGRTFSVEINVYNSIVDLVRAASRQRDGYTVLSCRLGLIWDQHLLDRIIVEIADIDAAGVPWICLSADGIDHTGKTYVSAHFNNEPSLAPDRGRRIIVQSSGTLCILNASECARSGIHQNAYPELNDFINANILMGYSHGISSHFTSNIYPCILDYKNIQYHPLDDYLSTMNKKLSIYSNDDREIFSKNTDQRFTLFSWITEVQKKLLIRHRFSFVVRTIFRRQHLLRRCLISIEYIRHRLGFEAEIVIATDIDEHLARQELAVLRDEFPNLIFVLAQGNNELGYSRVRNLLAGLKASSGSRVAIIDDDDYYTPQAVECFQHACQYGRESLLIFSTQIVTEKWTLASKKWHRELLSYGQLYDASGWEDTLRGSNSIPLCGIIHPGWFVREAVRQYRYDFDLSEDFVLHLLFFTNPKRPPVEIIEGVFAHQSHRHADDNVSTIEDRTGWVSDTGNGLFQFLFEQNRNVENLTKVSTALDWSSLNRRIEELEAELSRTRRDWALAEAELVAAKTLSPVSTAIPEKTGKMLKLVRAIKRHIKHI